MAAVTQVGVDIGSTSIRAVEAAQGKDDRPLISNFGQAMLPAGAVVGGVVKDDNAVSNALRNLWATQKFASRSVILGVSHQQVIVRSVDLPNLSRKEMRQALPFQVRDILPLPVEQAVLDFYPLEDPGKKETVHGLVIAAPKEPVMNMVQAVERAGLYVAQVDLSCFAALRASAHLAEDTEAVLDIGANGTNIIIHTDGVPQIVRTIPRGGTEVTDLIAKRLGVSHAEAETLKCQVGLLHTDGSESSDVVAEALRPLVNEIRSSLNYYRAGDPSKRVKRLALVGGSALLPGLSGQLTDQLGLPTFLADPLQRVSDTRGDGGSDVLGRLRSSAAVAIGLTLGAA
jgi:type IV pilus assembly protein PilM